MIPDSVHVLVYVRIRHYAIYCDILQNSNGAQVSYYVKVMRIRALRCSLLQPSKDWTQNPPPSLAYEFDSRSRHHYNQQFKATQNVSPRNTQIRRSLQVIGGRPLHRINIKHSTSNNSPEYPSGNPSHPSPLPGGWCMFWCVLIPFPVVLPAIRSTPRASIFRGHFSASRRRMGNTKG